MSQPEKSRASNSKRRTRIQQENESRILEAALETFSANGFRGTTIDQIADAAGMSKPNILYYFRNKEEMHRVLLDQLLDIWLDPLRNINASGDPLNEILQYVQRKLEISRKHPRESRLFANEVLQGAPRIEDVIKGTLKDLVDEKAAIIQGWIDEGKIADCDPHHLIFSIWATTQHYADFDVQICAVLGRKKASNRFDTASEFLGKLFANGLRV